MILEYLDRIGFNPKEKAIYMALVDLGFQPASIIAKKCNLDRITTYKNAKKLVDKGFLKISYQNGIQCFGIESFEPLEQAAKEKMTAFEDLVKEFPVIKNLLYSRKHEEDVVPQLEVFEGEAGIKRLFRDLLFEVKAQDLKQVRMLTSNTFEEQMGDTSLSKFVQEFFEEIRKQKLDLVIYEATGTLVPERLEKMSHFNPEKLPAARGTTNIFLAGHSVYLACYRTTQIGLKIKQADMSQIFHFLFDFMEKK